MISKCEFTNFFIHSLRPAANKVDLYKFNQQHVRINKLYLSSRTKVHYDKNSEYFTLELTKDLITVTSLTAYISYS